MNRFFIFLFFVLSINLQAAAKWKYQYQFDLKKDQIAKVHISYKNKSIFLKNGEFDFRWTLYKTGSLITFSSYQKVQSQHVLHLGYKLNSYNVTLVPNGSSFSDRIYLTVVFNSFDKGAGVAKIDMFIKDDNSKILAEFIDPNKDKNAK